MLRCLDSLRLLRRSSGTVRYSRVDVCVEGPARLPFYNWYDSFLGAPAQCPRVLAMRNEVGWNVVYVWLVADLSK